MSSQSRPPSPSEMIENNTVWLVWAVYPNGHHDLYRVCSTLATADTIKAALEQEIIDRGLDPTSHTFYISGRHLM